MDNNITTHFMMELTTYPCWNYSLSMLVKWVPGGSGSISVKKHGRRRSSCVWLIKHYHSWEH